MVRNEASPPPGLAPIGEIRSFFVPRARGEYQCRYCLDDFQTEEAVGYCVYAPDGRHQVELRRPWHTNGYR